MPEESGQHHGPHDSQGAADGEEIVLIGDTRQGPGRAEHTQQTGPNDDSLPAESLLEQGMV